MSCPNTNDDANYNYGNAGYGTSIYGAGASPYLDNEDQLELYQILQSTLPSWLFEDCPQEIWYAYTKIFALVKSNVIDQDQARTYILKATGIWLDQHARDRGTYRQPNESDESLRTRLRHSTDTVNCNSIVFDASLHMYDGYTGGGSFTATYEVLFTDQKNNNYVVGTLTYSGTTTNDGSHPKYIGWRSLGAGTYSVYRTANTGTGGTGLIGTTDGYTAYNGRGVADGYGNILDEGLFLKDNGQAGGAALPNTSSYIIPDLGIVKQILNNGDGYGPYNCTGNYPGLVELRKDKAFFHTIGTDTPNGFFGRGRRYWNRTNGIVVILPYSVSEGYPPAILDSVAQAVNRLKAGGILSFVEAYDGGTPLY